MAEDGRVQAEEGRETPAEVGLEDERRLERLDLGQNRKKMDRHMLSYSSSCFWGQFVGKESARVGVNNDGVASYSDLSFSVTSNSESDSDLLGMYQVSAKVC